MKTIILITCLLISINVRGQVDGSTHFLDSSIITKKYVGEINSENSNAFLINYYYGFKLNNKIFILSYEPNSLSHNNRNLKLYSSDDYKNWVEASSDVIQTDYQHSINNDNRNIDQYISKGMGNGLVKILNNGCILIIITNKFTNFNYKNEHDEVLIYKYNSVIILIPNKDNNYSVIKYTPTKNNPEILINNKSKIIQYDNIISIISNTNDTLKITINNNSGEFKIINRR